MKILISKKEYYEKVFQSAMKLLPTLITNDPGVSLKKEANRETLAFSSVLMAKTLLKEIGYTPQGGDSTTRVSTEKTHRREIDPGEIADLELDDDIKKVKK